MSTLFDSGGMQRESKSAGGESSDNIATPYGTQYTHRSHVSQHEGSQIDEFKQAHTNEFRVGPRQGLRRCILHSGTMAPGQGLGLV